MIKEKERTRSDRHLQKWKFSLADSLFTFSILGMIGIVIWSVIFSGQLF